MMAALVHTATRPRPAGAIVASSSQTPKARMPAPPIVEPSAAAPAPPVDPAEVAVAGGPCGPRPRPRDCPRPCAAAEVAATAIGTATIAAFDNLHPRRRHDLRSEPAWRILANLRHEPPSCSRPSRWLRSTTLRAAVLV